MSAADVWRGPKLWGAYGQLVETRPEIEGDVRGVLGIGADAHIGQAIVAATHDQRAALQLLLADAHGAEVARRRQALLKDVRSGAWLDAQHFEPLRYHVPRMVPEGLTLLVGSPKVGKSWMGLGIGLGVADGGEAFPGVAVNQRPVFYLALEDGDRRLQDRSRKLLSAGSLGEAKPIPDAFEYLTRIDPDSVADTISEWLAGHVDDTPLVILDTLGRVLPPAAGGESSYQRDYRTVAVLKAVIDAYPGAAGLVNHHDRKARAEDFVAAVSGTYGLGGAADTVVKLSRRRHEAAGLVEVTGRDVIEGAYAVNFTSGRWRLDGDSFEAAAKAAAVRQARTGLDDRASAVIDYVASQPKGGALRRRASGAGGHRSPLPVSVGRRRTPHSRGPWALRGAVQPVNCVRSATQLRTTTHYGQ
jgi:hypothetical protein